MNHSHDPHKHHKHLTVIIIMAKYVGLVLVIDSIMFTLIAGGLNVYLSWLLMNKVR